MPARTPPKGRPTTGRRDRQVATRTARSRSTTKKVIWAILALALLGAVLVIGSGSGGSGTTTTGSVLPLLALRPGWWRAASLPAPRS